jgi:hypothetical protein
MAKSKAQKRKAAASSAANPPSKHQKTSNQTSAAPPSPPLSDDNLPITNLHSVISQEEVEVTIDTLTTLAEHPALLKTKAAKDLRVAVYNFRQASTTGSSSLDADANLTARISAALVDGQFTQARILLAEMGIRGETPKLGALCRWVRDLDVVSGLAGGEGMSKVGPQTEREREMLVVLDAVLRVTGTVDLYAPVRPKDGDAIAVQGLWDLRDTQGSTEEVYEKVLDGSLVPETGIKAEEFPVIEVVPALERKPANAHPAILYTNLPTAIPLPVPGPKAAIHAHPAVPSLSLIKNLLSADECKKIIAAGESVTFLPDAPLRQPGEELSILAHNFYWVVDQTFHDALWARCQDFVPERVGGRKRRGLNRRFRVYRYVPGAEYRLHIDGAWPPSGIVNPPTQPFTHPSNPSDLPSPVPGCKYEYDSSLPERKQSSLFTFLIYLNDDFEGGETTFFLPSAKPGVLNAYPVRPVMGSVAVFPHGDAREAPLHEGTGVRKGAKYVIRTDVEYDVVPGLD